MQDLYDFRPEPPEPEEYSEWDRGMDKADELWKEREIDYTGA